MEEIDYIMLNCFGTVTNMVINSQILDNSTRNNAEMMKVLQSILEELKELNRR